MPGLVAMLRLRGATRSLVGRPNCIIVFLLFPSPALGGGDGWGRSPVPGRPIKSRHVLSVQSIVAGPDAYSNNDNNIIL